jgi:hypothetical protein
MTYTEAERQFKADEIRRGLAVLDRQLERVNHEEGLPEHQVLGILAELRESGSITARMLMLVHEEALNVKAEAVKVGTHGYL